MKTKKQQPRKTQRSQQPVTPPKRMYMGHLRTEQEIAILDKLRAEAIAEHIEYLKRRPSWCVR